MRFASIVLACSLTGLIATQAGCGLVLDYDPPTDGGMDVPTADAAIDASRPDCRTDLDCANGNPCDGEERCVDHVCAPGNPIACADDDDDVCDGVSTCDPSSGLCLVGPALECGDDDDPCNGVERCDPVLGCVTGPVPDCDDGIACTDDACVARMGCEHVPVDERCDAAMGGVCGPGGCRYDSCTLGVTCIAEDPCFVARCEESSCVYEPIVCSGGQECCAGACVAAGCDDGNECTDDHCGRRRGCLHEPRVGSCSDGNGCTLNDVCVEGLCTSGPRRPCTIIGGGAMCVAGACDDASGSCVTMPLNGTSCVDANYCTVNDVCVAGVCTSGSTAADCDDGEFCTADSCETAMGCQYRPLANGTTCPGIVASVCIDGRCVGTIGCDAGANDCDDDGVCECNGPCSGRLCAATDARCLTVACTGTERCCETVGAADFGMCVPASCPTCCTIR